MCFVKEELYDERNREKKKRRKCDIKRLKMKEEIIKQ